MPLESWIGILIFLGLVALLYSIFSSLLRFLSKIVVTLLSFALALIIAYAIMLYLLHPAHIV